MNDLLAVTKQLGEHYRAWKADEKDKEKKRKEFFDAATKEVKKKTLARKTIRVAKDTREDSWEFAARYNPKWKVLDAYADDFDGWVVVLEEDPVFKEFEFVNPEDGFVYKKTISSGGTLIDTETIQAEDPDFWEQISYVPEERILKPLEDLNHQQFVKLQKYAYQAPPKIQLSAPRKAKTEELASVEETQRENES